MSHMATPPYVVKWRAEIQLRMDASFLEYIIFKSPAPSSSQCCVAKTIRSEGQLINQINQKRWMETVAGGEDHSWGRRKDEGRVICQMLSFFGTGEKEG
jgi:hypothetical protein